MNSFAINRSAKCDNMLWLSIGLATSILILIFVDARNFIAYFFNNKYRIYFDLCEANVSQNSTNHITFSTATVLYTHRKQRSVLPNIQKYLIANDIQINWSTIIHSWHTIFNYMKAGLFTYKYKYIIHQHAQI